MKQFQLQQELNRALTELGYTAPTPVQQEVIPAVLAGHDVRARAQTGSGKTAAYVIPICEQIDWSENKPQALVLTPTRELAVQVQEDFHAIGRFKRINAVAVYGKQPIRYQMTQLRQKTHVIVGTPGRVQDHIDRGTLKLDEIRYVVLDEADEMLNMGFIDQVNGILASIKHPHTTLLFSATYPESVTKLANRYLNNPRHVEIESQGFTAQRIEHYWMNVTEDNTYRDLNHVLMTDNPDSCILFCRTKDRVEALYDYLDEQGYNCDLLHGGMNQQDRLDVIRDFKRGDFRYLVATDVAARGLDIENVSLVVNVDIPLEVEAYVHRTGRTGRAGNTGKAITFVTPFEDKFLAQVEEYIGFSLTQVDVPADVSADQHVAFEEKMRTLPPRKKLKAEHVNEGILKLYFNGGKKKKLRAVDFVGTLCRIDGIEATDIGIISIQDTCTYIDILNHKGDRVLKAMKNTPIKGKMLKVHKAKK
ncbi:DEAD/DEAH box helicase [Caryophanon tenue]|uniref:ATP-dependent RNA helicase DbpA n=1 Tax=Caryophanon tenue TaxID=33978 RepID=A0A1C0YHG5_9BACL|nr:DEAD/DEAH box helicase [Caryophanon tenue]OCS86628.1 RNA helicase [Caryophanon tenue]